MTKPHESFPAISFGCTCLRLRKAARRVSQIYDSYVEPHGLTITQFGLLAHLSALPGISVSGLAEKLVMDPTTLTRNLRPLEKKGLVKVAIDPSDRRSRALHLTAAGSETFRAAAPAWAKAQRHMEQVLGNADVGVLHKALEGALDRLAK
jgi:DNA-binding MarR family transcriptional regulator